MEHTEETSLKLQVLMNRGHCTAGHYRDLFFIRTLLIRSGDIGDFPNTEKQRERSGKNHSKRPKQNRPK